MTNNPPPENEAAAPAPNGGKPQERRGKNLDHFYKMGEQQTLAANQSFFDSLSEMMESFKRQKKAKVETGAKGLGLRDYLHILGAHKKVMIITALLLALALLAAVIVPHIPQQMQRSAGYAAFQEQNYPDALHKLKAYLAERPNDTAAAYIAARAALYAGDAVYARETINALHGGARGKLDDEIDYYYAIVNLDKPDTAKQALNALVQRQPQHAGARLLRGLLLDDSATDVRQAREDFLQLDEILRGGDDGDLVFLHRYLLQSGARQLNPSLPRHLRVVPSALQSLIGIQTRLDGLIYRLQFSNASAFVDEQLTASNIANLHFTYLLLRQNELDEADSVLTGVARAAPDSYAVQQAAAMLAAYRGDYAAAAAQFAMLAERLPTDAKTLNNQAVAEVLAAVDDEIDVGRIAALYEGLFQSTNAGAVDESNGAYFFLLAGEVEKCRQLLDRAEEKNAALPQTALIRALLSWVDGDGEKAVEQFGAIPAEALPRARYYVVDLYNNRGDKDAAIDLLAEIGADAAGAAALVKRLILLTENGEWRPAYYDGRRFVDKHRSRSDSRYILGKAALRLNEEQEFNRQKLELDKLRIDNPSDAFFAYALEGAQLARAGNAREAAAAYRRVINALSSGEWRNRFIREWAVVSINENPAEVARLLENEVGQNDSEMLALLAHALADDNAIEASEYAAQATANEYRSYLTNLHAGAAFLKVGNHRAALPLLEAASNSRPGEVSTLLLLQQAYELAGDSPRARATEAVVSYLQAVARGEGPQTKMSYRVFVPQIKSIAERVRAALTSGGDSDAYEKAVAVYNAELKAAEEGAPRAEILYSRATFEAYSKNYDEAIELFQESFAVGLDDVDKRINSMLFYAEVLSLNDRYDQAVQVLQQVIDLSGGTLLHRRLHAQALAASGAQQRAADLLDELTRQFPIDRDTYYALADLQVKMQEYDLAILTLRRLLSVDPNYAPAYRLLAEIHLLIGNGEEANYYSALYTDMS